MSLFTKLANAIFSPVDAAGNQRQVENVDAQRWGTEVESALAVFQAGGGIILPTLAAANGALNYQPNQMAWVLGDSTNANNGIYRKIGASGSGSWTRLGDLPFSFIQATNAGAGTPNAIVATANLPIPVADGGSLVSLNITTANTGSPVTVSFDGGTPLTITDVTGSPVSAGGLTAGMVVAGYKVGGNFRILIGPKGWSPLHRIVNDGARRVLELYDWTGGQGATPSTTGYVAASGITANIAEAVDIRGPEGPGGTGAGDMLASVYDPGGISGNAFDGLPVPDAAYMAGLEPGAFTGAFLMAEGRQGMFGRIDNTSGDYDALIAVDMENGEIVVPSGNPDLPFLRQRKNGDSFKLSEEGGDLRRALAVASERAKLDGLARTYLEMNMHGTVGAFVGGIAKPKNVELVGMGVDTVLDASGVPNVAALVNGFFLDANTDGFRELPSFTSVLRGASKMTFAAPHGLAPGSIVNIWNEAPGSFLPLPDRSYYHDGEINEIVHVDGLDAYFLYPFENDWVYTTTSGATLKVYETEVSRAGMSGFTIDFGDNAIVASAGTRGIRARRLVDVTMLDVKVLNATYAGIWNEQCLRFKTQGCLAPIKPGSLGGGGPGNQYGLLSLNSRDVRRIRCAAVSGWHADSLGGSGGPGAVPNMDYYAEDCDFTGTGTVVAVDTHGNAKRVTRFNCRINGGINLNGYDNTYDRCVIYIHNPSVVQGISWSEVAGGKHRIVNSEIYSTLNFGTAGANALLNGMSARNAYLREDAWYEIKNTLVHAPNENLIGYLRNYSPTKKINYDFEFELFAPVAANYLFRIREEGTPTQGGSDLCRIKPVGAYPNIRYASWENGYAPTFYDFPDQQVVSSITTTATTAVSSALINLPHGYPAVPVVLPTMYRAIGSAPFTAENLASYPTALAMRFTVRNSAGGNLAAGTAEVGWTAKLSNL